jgi:hypothetical protein
LRQLNLQVHLYHTVSKAIVIGIHEGAENAFHTSKNRILEKEQ